jgi:hypothetical protein
MFGKGRMYKGQARPEPVEDLLFSDLDIEDDLRTTSHAPVEEKIIPVETSTELNTLAQVAQTIVNQRKVSKILILFDDGTYQEM